jgi:hypothetical protein
MFCARRAYIVGHLAVAGGVVEEEEADAARVGNLEDGDGVVELRVHVVAAPVARRVQIARVGLADEHAHVGVQVALRRVAVLPVAVENRGRFGRRLRVVRRPRSAALLLARCPRTRLERPPNGTTNASSF